MGRLRTSPGTIGPFLGLLLALVAVRVPSFGSAAPVQTDRLADALRAAGVPVSGFSATQLATPITSWSASDAGGISLLGYYVYHGTQRLDPPLRVIRYDRRARRLTTATFGVGPKADASFKRGLEMSDCLRACRGDLAASEPRVRRNAFDTIGDLRPRPDAGAKSASRALRPAARIHQRRPIRRHPRERSPLHFFPVRNSPSPSTILLATSKHMCFQLRATFEAGRSESPVGSEVRPCPFLRLEQPMRARRSAPSITCSGAPGAGGITAHSRTIASRSASRCARWPN